MPQYDVKYFNEPEDTQPLRSETINAKDETEAAEIVRANLLDHEKLAVIEWQGLGGRQNSWTVGPELEDTGDVSVVGQ